VKPQPGDTSIVDKTGTFLMWYDMKPCFYLTGVPPIAMLTGDFRQVFETLKL
jgi:hypothetical protein